MAVLDPTVQSFIDQLAADGGPAIYTLTPDQARGVLSRMQSSHAGRPRVQVEDRDVNWRSRTLRLRIVRPNHVKARAPVIMYFHGAGWVMGDVATHDRLVRELAVGADATLIFVEYDRAPEHPYPIAIEEAYAATLYVAEHGQELYVDPTRLAVAGDSVGGNMATVVSLLTKQRSGPAIAGQLLFYPVTDADFDTHSYDQFAQGPWLTKLAMQWFWDQYLPDHDLRKLPTASPLRASITQLAGLPPALVITAENDVLRDEGEAYGRKLIEAGVEVVTTRYNAVIHDFVLLNALAESAPVRAAVAQATCFLRHVLASTEHACGGGTAILPTEKFNIDNGVQ